MIAAAIDKKASRLVPMLVVAAVSSLVTTWAMNTPYLSKRAETATTLEKKVIPKLKDVAGCQTARARVATQMAKDSEHGQDIDLTDIPNCPNLKPAVKVPSVTVSGTGPKLPS